MNPFYILLVKYEPISQVCKGFILCYVQKFCRVVIQGMSHILRIFEHS